MALRNILVMFAAACLDAAKVCYPYFGYVNDYGWTFVQNVARSYVDNELGTTSEYTEGVFFLSPDWPFDPTPAQEAVYETYAKDCDIILSGSNAMDPVTKKVAAKYPHIKFIIIGHIPRPTTLTNYAFTYIRAYQGKYIGGMVAASQPGVKTLGYVGSYPGPDSYQHVNAFYLGAASVNPNIKMYNINVMSWYDLEKERIAALQLIALYDCDLLSFDSDSDEVAKVAAEEGKLSVGYKGDNAIANGNSVLVSVVFDWRQVFKQLMQSALDGTWSSKYQSFEYVGFDGKAVSMGTFSTRVDSSTREKAKRIIQEFEAKNDTVYCSADGGFIDTKGIFQKPMNNGSCFSMESENSDLQQMNWLHGGITDLGPLSAHTKPDVRTCYAFFGPTSDFGWTYVQNFARNYVDVNLPGSTSEYVENVAFMNDTKQREVLDNFIDKGCHIIVLASGVFSKIANEYAAKHPATKFIDAGLWYNLGHQNLATAYIRVYQGKYVAGMLAALQPGVSKIGYVGAMRIADSMRDANAFYMGAKSVNPNIEMVAYYTGSWYAPFEEKIAALRLFYLHGVQLVSYDSDSDTLCKVALEEGKLSIGYKSDCTVRHGDTNLASVVLNWNEMFYTLVKAERDGLWKAKWQKMEFVGFENSGLTLGTYSTKVDIATRSKLAAQMASFAAGNDKIFCQPLKNQSNHTILPDGSDGCFTDAYLLGNFNWLQAGIQDLGLMPPPTAKIHSCYAFFGPITDFGWTYAQNLARNYIDANYEGYTSEFVEDVAFMDQAGQEKVLDKFAGSGKCDVAILASGVFSDIANRYAEKYPQINWIGAGLWYNNGHANLATAYIRIYQGKYVAGMVAASQPGVKKVGYVGSMRIPDAMRDANAFYMGAKSVNPDIEMVTIYTGSWFAPREERIAVLRLFDKHQVDLVSYDSDSDTLCKIAAESNKLSIGYKSDCTVTWGNTNLAAVVLDWAETFKLLIGATKDGLWSAHSHKAAFVGFEKSALTMGTYSTKVAMSTRLKADKLIASFAAGNDKIWCQPLKNQGGQIIMPDGSNGCFSDDYLHGKLNWLQDGIQDLGMLEVSSKCSPGTRLDALSEEVCVQCTGTTYTDEADLTECKQCGEGLVATNGFTGCEVPKDNAIYIVIGVGGGVLVLGLMIGLFVVRHFQKKVALMEKFAKLRLPENVQEELDNIYNNVHSSSDGNVCQYIPALKDQSPDYADLFGVVICDLDGIIYKAGATEIPHTFQSACKVLLFCQAMMEQGKAEVSKKIGTEPTGKPFDEPSIDMTKKIVMNPYVNAGGITSAGMIAGTARERYEKYAGMCNALSTQTNQLNEVCYNSEMATNFTNQNITRQLSNVGLVNDGPVALDAYTLACSIDLTAKDCAVIAASLANKGKNPLTNKQVIPEDITETAVSIMISCGMYNGAGQWIVDVGVPAKSGVGGGVIGVVPGVCGFATFSPRLDQNGNSVRGVEVAKAMSEALGLHVLKGGRK